MDKQITNHIDQADLMREAADLAAFLSAMVTEETIDNLAGNTEAVRGLHLTLQYLDKRLRTISTDDSVSTTCNCLALEEPVE